MKKNEMKKIENLLNDFGFEVLFNEENQKYQLSKKNYNELIDFLNENSEENINIENFEIKNQIHIKRDKDIKVGESRKIDKYRIKLIYHRLKDESKEYRIFIAYKNEDNKLKRIRLINEDIKEIHLNEKKMIEYFEKIKKNQIEKYLKEKVS